MSKLRAMNSPSPTPSSAQKEESTRPLKTALLFLGFKVTRLLMRQPLPVSWRDRIWDKVVRPYLAWRPITHWTQAKFGARFYCSLQDFIQTKILYFGVWEPPLTQFISSQLRAGDCFIDVGANIGYFSILASTLVGHDGKVVSIEASPRIYAKLKTHADVNNCDNLRAVNLAVSDSSGRIKLYRGPDWNIGATSTLESRGQILEAEVNCETLDVILLPIEKQKARIIKIDVEGAEAPILRNLLANIHTYPQTIEIVVEMNPPEIEKFNTTMGQIITDFSAAGFHPYVLENDYSTALYCRNGRHAAPKRIRKVPDKLVDVIFSRRDADTL